MPRLRLDGAGGVGYSLASGGGAPAGRGPRTVPAAVDPGEGRGLVVLRLAALWLALTAPAGSPEAGEAGGVVVVDALELLDEPSDSAFDSGPLKRGDRVAIARTAPATLPTGWLAIAPPAGAFDWVDSAAIQARNDGTAEVVAARARVRSGNPDARMPGPPRPALPRGASVKLLDRPSLTVGEGPKTRSWKAIEPPAGRIYYVRANAIQLDPEIAGADLPPASSLPPKPSVDPAVEPTQARRPGGRPSPTPSGGDSSAADAIRRFEDAIRRSRSLDVDAAQARRALADARTGTDRAYDARGLLQASSRKVDGEKVHALIGPEGVPIAYLAIPPGISAHRMLARKVGVRGDVHFNEALGARLITVRDLDPLDRPR